MKKMFYLGLLIAGIMCSMSLAEEWQNPLVDNYQTTALWNMNTLSTLTDNKVINYDSVAYLPRTNRHLRFFNGAANGGTLISSGLGTGFGNAAQFDGVDDYAKTFITHPINNGFKFEAWVDVNSTTVNGSYLIEVPGSWYLTITDANKPGLTRINMYIADASGVFSTYCCRLAITPNAWKHITASFQNGAAYLSVDGTSQQGTANLTNTSLYKSGQLDYTWVGRHANSGYYFKGLMDDVRLSDPGAEAAAFSVYSDTIRGTQALYHFDEINGSLTPDDSSVSLRTPMDITLYNSPAINEDTYPANNADFGSHMTFDGMTTYLMKTNLLGLDPANFRVEAWVKMEPDWWTGSVGQRFFIARKNPTFWLYASIHTNNVPKITFMGWVNGVAKEIVFTGCPLTEWTHIAAEYYNGTAKLYVNGGLASTATYGPLTVSSGEALSIGSNLSGNIFWGSIDEFRLSNVVTPEAQCGDYGYLEADLDRNCVVDMLDLSIMLDDWLKCTADAPGCVDSF